MRKEAVVVLYALLSQYFPGGAEENNENLIQNSWGPDGNSNQGPPEFKSDAFPLGSICSVPVKLENYN